jgi:hypothetical protein
VFFVELQTRSGPVSERYETYEEARRRIDSFPAESLLGMPFIFQELPDGSQRLVREDGKPLQWHRLATDAPTDEVETVPLSEDGLNLFDESGRPRAVVRFVSQAEPEESLPLVEDVPGPDEDKPAE